MGCGQQRQHDRAFEAGLGRRVLPEGERRGDTWCFRPRGLGCTVCCCRRIPGRRGMRVRCSRRHAWLLGSQKVICVSARDGAIEAALAGWCGRHDAELYFYPMNESNRRIASINRIDELNQRIAFQNDPLIASWAAKTVPKEPKTPSRRPKSPPRPSKKGPRAPKSGPRPPQDDPRTPQEPSWNGLGAILGPTDHKIENQVAPSQWWSGSRGRFWLPKWVPKRPQDDPKTSQKSRQKMHDFLIALGPVLDRS